MYWWIPSQIWKLFCNKGDSPPFFTVASPMATNFCSTGISALPQSLRIVAKCFWLGHKSISDIHIQLFRQIRIIQIWLYYYGQENFNHWSIHQKHIFVILVDFCLLGRKPVSTENTWWGRKSTAFLNNLYLFQFEFSQHLLPVIQSVMLIVRKIHAL